MEELTVSEASVLVGGTLRGEGHGQIRGVAPLENASASDLSFVANPRYVPYLQDTRAGGVLVSPELADRVPAPLPAIVVDDPHVALYRLMLRLYPEEAVEPAVHPTAVVDPSAAIGPGVSIGPYAVVESGAQLGAGCRIGAHSVVGKGAKLGAGTVIHPHVTLYHGVVLGEGCVIHSGARIGKQGFGFVWLDGGHQRVPQVGGCVLGDRVEVGCNTTIDRGSIGDTAIGEGTKIDNLVQLGHNDRIGRHVILVSQVGISGSTRVGDGAVLGGQAGVGGHLEIGAGARIGAQAGVISDVPAQETYSGYPARPHREALRAQGLLFRLGDAARRLKQLERAVFGEKR